MGRLARKTFVCVCVLAGLAGLVPEAARATPKEGELLGLSWERDILSGIVLDEMLPLQRQLNWCNDQRIVSEYSTDDPAQPGIYVMSTEQRDAMAEQLGSARDNWVRENTDEGSHGFIESFVSEARALSAENPMGSSALEATDCASLASYFEQYGG